MEPTLQGRVVEAPHKESTLIHLPRTIRIAGSPHSRASVENRHGEYGRREDAGKSRDGQETRGKREMTPVKSNASSEQVGSAGEKKRCRKNIDRNRKTSKRRRKNRAGDTSSRDSEHPTRTGPKLKIRIRLEGGAEIGQDVLIPRSSLQVSPNRATSRTGRAAADIPAASIF